MTIDTSTRLERLRATLAPLQLLTAAAWAASGALCAREAGVIGAACIASLAMLVCAFRRRADVAALALPAALGALEFVPAEPVWPAEGPIRMTGVVAGTVARDSTLGLMRFDVVPQGGGRAVRCIAPLRGREPADRLLPGDRVRGPGFLRDPTRRLDRSRAPTVEVELAALQIVRGPPTPQRLATELRFRLEDALRRALPDEAGRVCTHLVLGSGPHLPDDLVDAHRATGLAHLLAVSGAHASLLAWMLAAGFAFGRGRDPWQARRFGRLCACVLFGYGAVTGFDPPVLRALVAWLVIAMAAARGRRTGVTAALAAPTVVTALAAPDELFSISFCLSYAAVIGLAASGAFKRVHGFGAHLGQAARASTWAMLATAPFTLGYFGQLAPWTILGTPLLAPIVAAMLALGILTAVLGLVSEGLAEVPAWPLQFLTDGYSAAVRTLAGLPAAPIHANCIPSGPVLTGWIALGIGAMLLRPDRRGLAAFCVLTSLPFFLGPAEAPPPGLVLCSVGHGQAAVAHLPGGQIVVVDCGNLDDPLRAAQAVQQELTARVRIDLLVLSHRDSDHTAGVLRLARRVPIVRALLPVELEGSPIERALAAHGTAIDIVRPGNLAEPVDGVLVFAPTVPHDAASNERSLWTRIETSRCAIVLPGDATGDGIRAALRQSRITAPAGVLVLPHHGSAPLAPFDELLRAIGPRACLASTGVGTEPPLVRAARSQGIDTLTTEAAGALRIEFAGDRGVTADRPTHIPLRR